MLKLYAQARVGWNWSINCPGPCVVCVCVRCGACCICESVRACESCVLPTVLCTWWTHYIGPGLPPHTQTHTHAHKHTHTCTHTHQPDGSCIQNVLIFFPAAAASLLLHKYKTLKGNHQLARYLFYTFTYCDDMICCVLCMCVCSSCSSI